MACLYRATSPVGKRYIGITKKTADLRWIKHVEHAEGRRSGALYAAIRKYGADNFTIETLVVADDWDYLCELERRAIAIYNSLSPGGYNLTLGGEGTVGPRDEKARKRISIAQKKRYERPGERERLRAAGEKGRANRQTKAPKPKPPRLSREEHSARTKAAMLRPEVYAKVLASAAKRAADPLWRKRISASKTGKRIGPCPELRKQRIAAARRREWADPQIRERRLIALAIARAALAAKRSAVEKTQ